jgi:hypothetical protein
MSLHHQDEAVIAVCLTLNMKERLELFNTTTWRNVTDVFITAEK